MTTMPRTAGRHQHERRNARARPHHHHRSGRLGVAITLAVGPGVAALPFSEQPSPGDDRVLMVAGCAMGLQAGALRQVGQVAVAATYGTGAIVHIGEKVVLAARRASPTTEHRRREAVVVLVVVLVAYVAGTSPLLLLAPALTVAACAVASR